MLVDVGGGQLCELPVFIPLHYNLLLSLLTVHPLGDILARFDVLVHFLGVLFDQTVLLPDFFCLEVSFLGIDVFLVLPFESVFVLLLMDFDIVFDSLHDDLLVEVLLCPGQSFVGIVFELNALANAVHLEGLNAVVDAVDLLLPKRLV